VHTGGDQLALRCGQVSDLFGGVTGELRRHGDEDLCLVRGDAVTVLALAVQLVGVGLGLMVRDGRVDEGEEGDGTELRDPDLENSLLPCDRFHGDTEVTRHIGHLRDHVFLSRQRLKQQVTEHQTRFECGGRGGGILVRHGREGT